MKTYTHQDILEAYKNGKIIFEISKTHPNLQRIIKKPQEEQFCFQKFDLDKYDYEIQENKNTQNLFEHDSRCPHCNKKLSLMDTIQILMRNEIADGRVPVAISIPENLEAIINEEIESIELTLKNVPSRINERTILGLSIISGPKLKIASYRKEV